MTSWTGAANAVVKLRLVGDSGADGDGGAMTQHSKKGKLVKFVVWIHAGTTMKNLLEYVFHEMTHVKQAIFDGWELQDEEDIAFWKGDIVQYTGEGDSYWNAPWEVEARKMGRVLRKKYIKRGM